MSEVVKWRIYYVAPTQDGGQTLDDTVVSSANLDDAIAEAQRLADWSGEEAFIQNKAINISMKIQPSRR